MTRPSRCGSAPLHCRVTRPSLAVSPVIWCAQVLLEDEGLGYEEDTTLSNLKLIVGFGGVGASLVSHVHPAPFPRNWWVLLICCTLYFVCSGILQYLLSFVELESILLVRGKKGEGGKRGAGLNLHSHFPRFQEVYTLGLTPLPRGSLRLPWAPMFTPRKVVDGQPLASSPDQKQWSCAQVRSHRRAMRSTLAVFAVSSAGHGRAEWCCCCSCESCVTPRAQFFDEDGNFEEEAFEAAVYDFVRDYEEMVVNKSK